MSPRELAERKWFQIVGSLIVFSPILAYIAIVVALIWFHHAIIASALVIAGVLLVVFSGSES